MNNEPVSEKEYSENEHSMKGRALIIAVLLIACLALGLIAFKAFARPKITGVKSLVAANIRAQSKVKNYHMDGDVDMDITFDNEELQSLQAMFDLKLPVKMTLRSDAGSESAHVITDAAMTIFGNTVQVQSSESYLDMKNMAVYSRTGESAQWKKSGDHADQMGFKELLGGIAVAGKTVMENASFSETDEFYTLTMPAEKTGDIIKDLHLLDRVELGIADVRDISVEGGQIVYNVDKTTLLVSSVDLVDVDCRGKGTYAEISVDLRFMVNGSFVFSRYNEVEESKYMIPPEVIRLTEE